MKKSSNIKSIHVNEEISKKAAAVDLELKDIDLKEIIRMDFKTSCLKSGCLQCNRQWPRKWRH